MHRIEVKKYEFMGRTLSRRRRRTDEGLRQFAAAGQALLEGGHRRQPRARGHARRLRDHHEGRRRGDPERAERDLARHRKRRARDRRRGLRGHSQLCGAEPDGAHRRGGQKAPHGAQPQRPGGRGFEALRQERRRAGGGKTGQTVRRAQSHGRCPATRTCSARRPSPSNIR